MALLVVLFTVRDHDLLDEYKRLAAPSIAAAGARSAPAPMWLDDSEEEVVAFRFPSRDALLAWWHSSAYQASVPTRERAMDARFLFLDG
ncbi:MAG: DUF1330 domain-containing protein [Deltaproteobacteria bacterium]|nr:MAG: DUF1330 domain-containing protein [Deltaproteobacteria bacterium]